MCQTGLFPLLIESSKVPFRLQSGGIPNDIYVIIMKHLISFRLFSCNFLFAFCCNALSHVKKLCLSKCVGLYSKIDFNFENNFYLIV